MIVTTLWVRENYIKFNKLFFDNKLPMIEFKVNRSKYTWGYASFRYDRYANKAYDLTLTISNFYDSPENIKKGTLLHEMIHIYDYVFYMKEHFYNNGKKVRGYNPHGAWFMKWAEKINSSSEYKIALHVTKEEESSSTYSEKTKQVINRKLSEGYFIVFMYAPSRGKYFMMKCNETQIKRISVWILNKSWGEYKSLLIYSCYDPKYVENRCSIKSSLLFLSKEDKDKAIKDLNMKFVKNVGELVEHEIPNIINKGFNELYDEQFDFDDPGIIITMS